MSGILTPALQMLARTQVRKRRDLPVPGVLSVAVGDTVTATQSIGTAELPGDLSIVRLPEIMGLQTFEVLQGIQVQEGQTVARKDLLSEHAGLFGLFRSRAYAPVSGTVEFITERTGHVGIRQAAIPIGLSAYVAGTVVAIEEGKGAVIEADAALVQGIFGIGGEKVGTLEIIAAPDIELTEAHIPDECTGKILVGGMRPTQHVVALIAERGGVGLVTGSLDDTFIKAYLGYDLGIALTGDESVPVTIIMTEGFGSLAMSARAYSLLSDCAGLEASINGATQVRAGAVRPEIIIPRTVTEPFDTPVALTLAVGSAVRLIRVPYFGARATVIELPPEAQRIETGARTRILKARLENGTEVIVPRANVELV